VLVASIDGTQVPMEGRPQYQEIEFFWTLGLFESGTDVDFGHSVGIAGKAHLLAAQFG
jgi:hypothetical protein